MEQIIQANWPIVTAACGVVGSYFVTRYRVEEMNKDIAKLEQQLAEHSNTITRLTVLEVRFNDFMRSQDQANQTLRDLMTYVQRIDARQRGATDD